MTAFCVIAASPRKVHWNEPVSRFQSIRPEDASSENEDGKFLYVPCFEEEEMLQYAQKAPSKVKDPVDFAKKRFRVVGGVARDFFNVTDPADDSHIKDAAGDVAKHDKLAGAIKELATKNIKELTEGAASHVLFKIGVPRSDCSGASYKYGKMIIQYLSEAAEEAVNMEVRNFSRGKQRRLYNHHIFDLVAGGNAFRGNMYEQACHSRVPILLENGLSTHPHRKPLDGGSDSESGEWEGGRVRKPNRHDETKPWNVEKLGKMDELCPPKITERTYYEAAKNFPAIDALFRWNGRYYVFQYTVQPKHHTINYDGLYKILMKLAIRTKDTFRYVFVHDAAGDPYKPGAAINKADKNEKLVSGLVTFWECRYDLRGQWPKLTLHPIGIPQETAKNAQPVLDDVPMAIKNMRPSDSSRACVEH